MDFDKELNILFEYSDYEPPLISKLKIELKAIHEIYPDLWPSRGWSSKTDHCIGLTGHLEINYKGTPCRVPFGISYPISYPSVPPQCNIITQTNHIIFPNSKIDPLGSIFVDSLTNWNSSLDSLSTIFEIVDFLSSELPLFDLDDVFISELWRLRSQIEDLNRDKILLKEEQKQVEVLSSQLSNIESQQATSEIKQSCDKLESELNFIPQEIDLNEIIEYKKPNSYKLLQVLGELEAIDDVIQRLEEAHNQKVLSSPDYILTLKRMFYDKFLLQKLKAKIISLS